MKKIFLTALCICLSTLFLSTNAMTEATKLTPEAVGKMIQQNTGLPASVVNMTTEEFLNLTPKKVKAMTGEKLSFKETIALKTAQKTIKKELSDAEGTGEGGKKKPNGSPVAGDFPWRTGYSPLLSGLHYLRHHPAADRRWLRRLGPIDLIRIITGDLKPADGSEYDPKL